MDREELIRLVADLESDRVERTVSLTNTDKFAQAPPAEFQLGTNHFLVTVRRRP